MRQLPRAAQVYVTAIIAMGVFLLAAAFPFHTFAHPAWFVTLLLVSSITSAFKVNLPLARSGSTMSVSYAVDFASLLLIGPDETMLVAATSAFCQCSLNSKDKNPFYRTLFSIAFFRAYIPSLCTGVDQHLARCSARFSERLPA